MQNWKMLKVQFHLWTFKSSKKHHQAITNFIRLTGSNHAAANIKKKIKILFGGSSTNAKVCGKLVHIWATTIVLLRTTVSQKKPMVAPDPLKRYSEESSTLHYYHTPFGVPFPGICADNLFWPDLNHLYEIPVKVIALIFQLICDQVILKSSQRKLRTKTLCTLAVQRVINSEILKKFWKSFFWNKQVNFKKLTLFFRGIFWGAPILFLHI